MRYVWRRRISAANVLFLVNRYVILAVSFTSIVQVLPWSFLRGKDRLNPDYGTPDTEMKNVSANEIARLTESMLTSFMLGVRSHEIRV